MAINNYMNADKIQTDLLRTIKMHTDLLENIVKTIDNMDIKEINKMLSDKNISPEIKKALEQRKDILLKNKTVKK